MQAPLYVTPSAPVAPPPGSVPAEVTDLLRQILDAQREQVALLRAQVAAQDVAAKWRAFLAKWSGEFPELGGACRRGPPGRGPAYLTMLRELTGRLRAGAPAAPSDDCVLS